MTYANFIDFFKEKRARACICQKNVVTLHAILRIWIFMRSILMAIGLVLVAMLLLCVGVIFRKDHSFRSQHIHQNKRMKEDGIHCALSEDKLSRRKRKLEIKN